MKINDPKTNLRECVKQLCLLESHLLERGKFCSDCISKHLLTLEALSQEGQGLDASRSLCQTFEALEARAHRWETMFAANTPAHAIGQEVRAVRKQLAQHVLDPECSKLAPTTSLQTDLGVIPDSVPAVSRNGLLLLAAAGICVYLWRKNDAEEQQEILSRKD